MDQDRYLPAWGAKNGVVSKKRWERPLLTKADVRSATQGGINMMADPLGGMMS